MASGALLTLAIVGAVAVVALVAWLGYLAAKARREEFAAFAAAHGWAWSERDDSWSERFHDDPFGHGFDRRASNVLTGAHDGRPFAAFDYRYSTTETSTVDGHAQTRTVHHPYSVVAVDTGARFPGLRVCPEGFVGRMVGRLTNSDIELESEDFNRMFTVSCEDRKFASDVLHPRMMQLLMRWPELSWRLQEGWLVVFHPGSHTTREVQAKLLVVDAIVDAIPDFVWRERLGSVPPAQHAGEDAT
jgi:hypothetical protein